MNALRQSARDGAAYTLGGPQVAGPLAVFPVFGPEPRLEYRAFVQAAKLAAAAVLIQPPKRRRGTPAGRAEFRDCSPTGPEQAR